MCTNNYSDQFWHFCVLRCNRKIHNPSTTVSDHSGRVKYSTYSIFNCKLTVVTHRSGLSNSCATHILIILISSLHLANNSGSSNLPKKLDFNIIQIWVKYIWCHTKCVMQCFNRQNFYDKFKIWLKSKTILLNYWFIFLRKMKHFLLYF